MPGASLQTNHSVRSKPSCLESKTPPGAPARRATLPTMGRERLDRFRTEAIRSAILQFMR